MIKLAYDATNQRADLVRNGGNIQTDAGLETAVLVRLFTDARAKPSDAYPGDQRGWWGSEFLDGDRELGSRLWIFIRGKITKTTLNDVAAAARDALLDLQDDKVVSRIEASCERMPGKLDVGVLTVKLYKPGETAPRFERKWEVQFGV